MLLLYTTHYSKTNSMNYWVTIIQYNYYASRRGKKQMETSKLLHYYYYYIFWIVLCHCYMFGHVPPRLQILNAYVNRGLFGRKLRNYVEDRHVITYTVKGDVSCGRELHKPPKRLIEKVVSLSLAGQDTCPENALLWIYIYICTNLCFVYSYLDSDTIFLDLHSALHHIVTT